MKILYMGYAVDDKLANSLSGASVAGNKMQLNILKELGIYQGIDLEVVTVYPVAPFPSDKKLFIRKKLINITSDIIAFRVGFLNIPVVKQFWQMATVYCQGKNVIKKSNKECVLLCYNMFPQVGFPLLWLQKKYKLKSICLLADLPLEIEDKKGFSALIYKWYYNITLKNLKKVKNIIVLNEKAQKIYASQSDYIVVEGGVDLAELQKIDEDDSATDINAKKNAKILIYSGTLTEYNGIRELLEAMNKIKHKEVVLHIYGDGPLRDYVICNSKKSSNVKYMGVVDNKTVLEKQREAFLLINPRNIDDEISQVTFPSKIFEYMLSGTPILTTRLNGFTEDYLDKMFFVNNNNSENLSRKIEEIVLLDDSVLNEIACKAREFVINEKNWKKQSEKIIEYILRE